ncbi:13300_t:CDS:2, partial [Gigaspora margarita]
FPDPEKMQKDLMNKGRKMVTIIDPHIKRDEIYYVYKEANDLDLLKNLLAQFTLEYAGQACSSSWIDLSILWLKNGGVKNLHLINI